jgi:S-formylglutathione hydrolase FrmB
MGGYGALLAGLRHPELFESVASISGVIFNQDKAIDLAQNRFLSWTIDIDRMLGDGNDQEFLASHNPYSLLDRLPAEERPRLFLAAGAEEPEPIQRPSTMFHEHLLAEGVEHEWLIYDGSHNLEDWAPVIERAIAHATAVE